MTTQELSVDREEIQELSFKAGDEGKRQPRKKQQGAVREEKPSQGCLAGMHAGAGREARRRERGLCPREERSRET